MEIADLLYLPIKRIIERGSAEILEETEDSILAKDTVSGTHLLATEDYELGKKWLMKYEQNGTYPIIGLCGETMTEFGLERYKNLRLMLCHQVVYLQKEPPAYEPALELVEAEMSDLDFILTHYHTVKREEMAENIRRRNMYLGVAEGKVVGFVGEHIEGSLGMLQVLDEYRKKGYGGELEKAMIAKHLEKGYTPFAHVEVHNTASINLQKKIGMEFLEKKIVWLY